MVRLLKNALQLAVLTLSLGQMSQSAHAGIIDFGSNGTGWTINSPGGGLTVASNVATLTSGAQYEQNSLFYNQIQSVSHWSAQFTYTAFNNPQGNGIAFIIQNSNDGTAALGTSGSGLGYGGIQKSAAYEMNIYDGFTLGATVASNGATDVYDPTGSVSLGNGHKIQVNLTYDQTSQVFTTSLKDLTTNDTFSKNYSLDLASILGGTQGYVGFSGGTGSLISSQTVEKFVFENGNTAAAPEPGTISLLAVGALGMLGTRLRKRKS